MISLFVDRPWEKCTVLPTIATPMIQQLNIEHGTNFLQFDFIRILLSDSDTVYAARFVRFIKKICQGTSQSCNKPNSIRSIKHFQQPASTAAGGEAPCREINKTWDASTVPTSYGSTTMQFIGTTLPDYSSKTFPNVKISGHAASQQLQPFNAQSAQAARIVKIQSNLFGAGQILQSEEYSDYLSVRVGANYPDTTRDVHVGVSMDRGLRTVVQQAEHLRSILNRDSGFPNVVYRCVERVVCIDLVYYLLTRTFVR